MVRKKIEDIIPSSRRRDEAVSVAFSNTRNVSKKLLHRTHSAGEIHKTSPQRIFQVGKKREAPENTRNRKLFFVWCGALIVVALITLLWFFDKATLTVIPLERSIDLDEKFNATEKAADGNLSFRVMESRAEETKTVKATKVEQVNRGASGSIIVYNNFSSSGQRLITNTRFETSEGLIYRIRESIIVPGQKITGGDVVPGSIKVMIYADEPGEKHNIGLTDFTIPGFRGLPQYEKFYARSETPMTGGFSGLVKTVSPEELEKIKSELQTVITQKLLKDAHSQKPDNFVLFNNAVFVSFLDGGVPGQQNINEETMTITVRGVLRGAIFKRDELEDHIGKMLIPALSPEEHISISNLEDLNFEFQDKESIDLENDSEILFTIKGRVHIVWLFDEEELKKALVGNPKKEFKTILTKFPSIKSAEVAVRPFWKRSFPGDVKNIKIKSISEINDGV